MILFFARDPGAANILVSIYQNIHLKKEFWAKDYARSIALNNNIKYEDFNKKVIDKNIGLSDEDIIKIWINKFKNIRIIVTGTSHYDDFTDRLIWKIAVQLNCETIAVLDQWIRVIERFKYQDLLFQPTFIITSDNSITRFLNSKNIPLAKALTFANPYIKDVYNKKWEINAHRDEIRQSIKDLFDVEYNKLIVFASEPHAVLNEYDANFKDTNVDIKDIFLNVKSIVNNLGDDVFLLVKLHPKERPSDFDYYPYCIKDEISSLKIISASDEVIGFKSFFLIESVLFEKKVVSIDFWDIADEELITNKNSLSLKSRNLDELKYNIYKEFYADIEAIKSVFSLNNNQELYQFISERYDYA